MIATTPKGDLIAGSTKYGQTLKYYYGLKKNGRPSFIKSGEETPFATTDSSTKRYEGNLFGIKMNLWLSSLKVESYLQEWIKG